MKPMKFRLFLVLAMLSIGAAVYLLTMWCPVAKAIDLLTKHTDQWVGIVSSYSFTVAGFLATISTFLFTLSDRPFFKLFKKGESKSFATLMFIHLITFVTLASLFLLSIFVTIYPCFTRMVITLTALTLFQFTGIALISFRLTSRAHE